MSRSVGGVNGSAASGSRFIWWGIVSSPWSRDAAVRLAVFPTYSGEYHLKYGGVPRMSIDRDAAQLELVEALGAVAFAVMGALTKLAAEHDLSLTQLRMLGILRDRRLTI